MDTYHALLRAADHLETHPDSYDFWTTSIPGARERETGGACAYGWTCHFLGVAFTHLPTTVSNAELSGYLQFSWRMRRLKRWYETNWHCSRKVAIRCLRRYAKTYHKPVVKRKPLWWPAVLALSAIGCGPAPNGVSYMPVLGGRPVVRAPSQACAGEPEREADSRERPCRE